MEGVPRGMAAKAASEVERILLPRPRDASLLTRLRLGLANALRDRLYRSRLYEFRLKGRHPLKLLGSPDDPWPGDLAAGEMLLDGVMRAGGETLPLETPDFWQAVMDRPALADYALGFAWLRDLARVTDQRRARVIAEMLMRGWLEQFQRYHSRAWQPALLARRLSLSLLHAPLILSNHDLVYRSTVLNAFARHTRHLARTAGDVAPGVAEIETAAALMLAGILLPHGSGWRERGEALLRRALRHHLLADGGVLSRSVPDLLMVMRQLISLRDAMIDRGHEPPEMLQLSLDRMAPFLRMLLHGDGRLAHMANGGAIAEELAEQALEASHARGKALEFARASGLIRLKAKRSLVLFDCMPPPPQSLSAAAHAGCLSFEFSDAEARIVVNIGSGAGDLSLPCRTSAAHSTLILNDTNSTEVGESGLGGGITEVRIARGLGSASHEASASHDGYRQRFSLLHHRRLTLAQDGTALDGEDWLEPVGKLPREPLAADLRFHLHPDVAASLTQGGKAVLLRIANRHGWLFTCHGHDPQIEDSLMIEDALPRRSQQIVVKASPGPAGIKLGWRFERL